MGPNPLKLEEELLTGHLIPDGATVCDLGSGQGLTSVFLVKEYGFKVFAADRGKYLNFIKIVLKKKRINGVMEIPGQL